MGGLVVSMLHQQQKLKRSNQFFQVIANGMDLTSKPLLMPGIVLHLYQSSVLEGKSHTVATSLP
jgi:hypothetical protein